MGRGLIALIFVKILPRVHLCTPVEVHPHVPHLHVHTCLCTYVWLPQKAAAGDCACAWGACVCMHVCVWTHLGEHACVEMCAGHACRIAQGGGSSTSVSTPGCLSVCVHTFRASVWMRACGHV